MRITIEVRINGIPLLDWLDIRWWWGRVRYWFWSRVSHDCIWGEPRLTAIGPPFWIGLGRHCRRCNSMRRATADEDEEYWHQRQNRDRAMYRREEST